jgi:DNA polymerase beta
MPNTTIIKQFDLLIKQIKAEISNAQVEGNSKEVVSHQFRLRSIQRALAQIKKLKEEITDSVSLKGTPDIGTGTLNRIDEILKTGTLSELKNKYAGEKQTKIDSIQELENVIGIGSAGAKKLVTKHGITSVKQLKKAVANEEIEVTNLVKLGLKYYDRLQDKIPRAEIKTIEKYLKKEVGKIDDDLEMEICGSYRRGKPTSGDIDILLYHPDVKTVSDIKKQKKGESHLEQLVDSLTKKGFLIDSMTDKNYQIKYMGFCRYPFDKKSSGTDKLRDVKRIDIRYIPYRSLPTALLYFTGPYELNTIMRSAAKKRSMILNEYGLYKIVDGEKKMVKIPDEETVFTKLGMDYLSPIEREKHSE